MDLDHRFRPSGGGRIILLGDGTELTDNADSEMFENDDEDKDLESQVNKFNKEDTPAPQSSTAQVTESPSSVQTEKSDAPEQASKESQTDAKQDASAVQAPSEK